MAGMLRASTGISEAVWNEPPAGDRRLAHDKQLAAVWRLVRNEPLAGISEAGKTSRLLVIGGCCAKCLLASRGWRTMLLPASGAWLTTLRPARDAEVGR